MESISELIHVRRSADIFVPNNREDSNSVNRLQITRLKVNSNDVAIILPLLNAFVDQLLENVNGVLVDQRIPITLRPFDISPDEFFSDESAVSVSGAQVTLSPRIEKSAVLVNSTGVHVAAKLGFDDPTKAKGLKAAVDRACPVFPNYSCDANCGIGDGEEPYVGGEPPAGDENCLERQALCKFREDNAREKYYALFNSEVICTPTPRYDEDAVMCSRLQVEDPGQTKFPLLWLRYGDVCTARSKVKARAVAPLSPVGQSIIDSANEKEFRERYAALSRDFEANLSSTLGLSVNGPSSKTRLGFLKPLVTGALETSVNSANLCVSTDSSVGPISFNEKIELPPATRLNCNSNRDCGSVVQACRKKPFSDFSCDRCSGWDIRCRLRKFDCERRRAMEHAAWEAREAVRYAACQAENLARRFDCERIKVMEEAGCRINQEWLDLWSGADVGRVRGSARGQVELQACVSNFDVSDKLDKVALEIDAHGGVDIDASLTFVPHDLIGHIMCAAKWSGDLHTNARLSDERRTFVAGIETRRDDERLVLDFKSQATEFKFKYSPNLVEALVRRNPDFAIVCSNTLLGLGISYLFEGNWPEDTRQYVHKMAPTAVEVPIDPIEIVLPGASKSLGDHITIKLLPSMLEKSVVFEEK